MRDAVISEEAGRGLPERRTSGALPLFAFRSPGAVAALAIWCFGCTFATIWATSMSSQRLVQSRAAMSTPSLWYQPNQDLIIFIFIIPLMLGMLLLATPIRWITKLTILVLLIAAMIGSSAVAMRGYIVVTEGQVIVRSSLPWRNDVHFKLADTAVVSRGCRTWRGKSGVYHDIIFRVRGGPVSQTIRLDQPAGHGVKRWLAVMRDYADGPNFPVSADAGAAPLDRDCMSYLLPGLDEDQAAELSRLLS